MDELLYLCLHGLIVFCVGLLFGVICLLQMAYLVELTTLDDDVHQFLHLLIVGLLVMRQKGLQLSEFIGVGEDGLQDVHNLHQIVVYLHDGIEL